MISPEEIKKKGIRRFHEVLQAHIQGTSIFPMLLKANLSMPKSFPDLQAALTKLISASKDRTGSGYAITYSKKNLRAHGQQDVPEHIVFENIHDYLKYCKLQHEFNNFIQAFTAIQNQLPALMPWAERFPEQLLKYAQEWNHILIVCQWFMKGYTKNCYYIREIPVAIPTKWIENHKPILRELFDFLQPDFADTTETQFEKRYYLKYALPVFRIRKLDDNISLPGKLNDFSTDINNWNQHPIDAQGILITENLMTYLTLPEIKGYIALFGKGFAVSQLQEIQWIAAHPKIWYWGDLDVHGFYILSELRKHMPHTQSILMDIQTLEYYITYAVPDIHSLTPESLPNLHPEEQQVYQYIRHNAIRLEQERIPQSRVLEVSKHLLDLD